MAVQGHDGHGDERAGPADELHHVLVRRRRHVLAVDLSHQTVYWLSETSALSCFARVNPICLTVAYALLQFLVTCVLNIIQIRPL